MILKNQMKNIVFFAIPIDTLSREEIVVRIQEVLQEGGSKSLRIATVGPEFLLRARSNPDFSANLLRADLRIADGSGVSILTRILFQRSIERIPGADLLHLVLIEAEHTNAHVFLAVKADGLSSFEEIRHALAKKYPKLKINGREYPSSSLRAERNHPKITQKLFSEKIVLCNFGAPEQEYFLEKLREKSKQVKLIMGIGGAFDFETGKLPRAPKLFRSTGLEWLWRLILQPKRWRRIFRAVVVFPILAIFDFLCPKAK